ncbi:MAG: multiheme c-type cytochrome [Candidatus Eisenbacteria bacterium]|nr:cytochrome c family protein [Candidatus Eisenbacteria bacterium]
MRNRSLASERGILFFLFCGLFSLAFLLISFAAIPGCGNRSGSENGTRAASTDTSQTAAEAQREAVEAAEREAAPQTTPPAATSQGMQGKQDGQDNRGSGGDAETRETAPGGTPSQAAEPSSPSPESPPETTEKPTEATTPAPAAAPAGNFKYVGVQACAICHKGASKGSIYEVWLASPHAQAFEALGAENQKNEVCLRCHTTGFGKALAAGVTPDKMVNVQCEACHGPGSEYRPMAVMKSRPAALEKGLVLPTEQVCMQCHGGPFPEGHPAVAFNYESALLKIEHHSKPTETK